ncbi:lipopolysaccharide biosynthesis protein [Rubritalea marina]|uniref:lipopolysaccharide biosynthesis protein n=1 Tax=Rubritalea marina TaxID=361055 RepID=UPI000379A53A|nr:oligosaccharide flippase family protein [Rubritalea marina]
MRTKRFISALLTGYGTVGANVIFTLASVPLVLSFLSKDHLGIWLLSIQITNYLGLMTMGVNASVWRHLADHKDEVESNAYCDNLITGSVLFCVLGVLVVLCGGAIAYFAPSYLGVPKSLEEDFFKLFSQLSLVSGASILLLSISAPLRAFQRQDIINVGNSVSVLMSLLLLWFGLSRGIGVSAFALAQIPATLGVPVVYFLIGKKMRYYPNKLRWRKPGRGGAMKMLSFSRDSFFVHCGSVLVTSCQLIIISKFVGIQAAATYAVASKLPSMGRDLISAPISAASQGMTELYVRGETKKFIVKYRQLIELTVIGSLMLSVAITSGNCSFVKIWTNGEIVWSTSGDLCLALLVILRAFNANLMNAFALVKRLKGIRFINFLELFILIPVAIWTAQVYGVLGVLLASIVVQLLTTSIIVSWLASRELGSLAYHWRQIGVGTLLICMIASSNSLIVGSSWMYQCIYVFGCLVFASIALWFFCVSLDVKWIVRDAFSKG